MALPSTVYQVELQLSDVDRGVYETLALRVAQHPSESDAYLVTRLLAYALEFSDGIAFSTGLSAADEPAVWCRDLTGALIAWIEVGTPDPARLHKAGKAAERVAVYCHKDPTIWLRAVAAARVYGADRLKIVVLPRSFIDALCARLKRRFAWQITVSDGTLYLDVDGESLSAPIGPTPLAE